MKRITLILVLSLLSTAALACMGVLVHSQVVPGGMLCTYQVGPGQNVTVAFPGQYTCPVCL